MRLVRRRFFHHLLFLIVAVTVAVNSSATAQVGQEKSNYKILVKVTDENGVPIADALLVLTQTATGTVARAQTDAAGRHEFSASDGGIYQLTVEKEGFYPSKTDDVRAGDRLSLDITIYHHQEIAEMVNVYAAPSAIDPQRTAIAATLGNREILALPYPSTRDYRKALPLIPGVVADATDQIHLGGSATHQILDQLDGFNITQPVNGLLEMRLSPDALQAMGAQSSRLSAQYGKGSGGSLNLTTGMGDDHYRFTATNFIPSLQNRKGLNFSEWTPRATFSGPLRKKKAWFFEAADAVVNQEIVTELPDGADRNTSWRVDNLFRTQVNLNERNILTAGFLINQFHSPHEGLSLLNPLEATAGLRESAYLATVKDQFYASNKALLEIGFAVNQFHDEERPQGSLPYRLSPEGASGNFFRTADTTARRVELISDLTLPEVSWHGSHEFKFGVDLERITDDRFVSRQPILIVRENGTLSREISFSGSPQFTKHNFEASGFAQDRWSISSRWLLEAGLRFDRDSIIQGVAVSPRVAATYLLTRDGSSKLSGGIGLYHDATNLDLVTRPLEGIRFDQLFGSDGVTPVGLPVVTAFQLNEANLAVPRFTNWSIGLEQKLPADVYLEVEFLQKRGHDVLAYFNRDQSSQPGGVFELRNDRSDKYDGLQITVRHTFKGDYQMLASYTRSRAHATAVLDPDIDNPVFSPQAAGPLPWDTPNHFIWWGWLPLIKKIDFAYSVDWRTGFPFNVVNQDQELAEPPGSRRFPSYFTLNTHVERRFRFFHYYVAVRAGFNNVTDRHNPTVVNNNIDSPQFLTFSGTQHRSFTGRIRFLGRK